MAEKTRAQLLAVAEDVRTETEEKANTCERVGGLFRDLIDSLQLAVELKWQVTAVATANIATLSGLTTTVDDVLLNTANVDGVLLTAQTDEIENGPWIVQTGPWTRPAWYAAGSKASGVVVSIQEGTEYLDTRWLCSTDDPDAVVDTDETEWKILPQLTATAQAVAYWTGSELRGANHFRVAAGGDACEFHGTGAVPDEGSVRMAKDVARYTAMNEAGDAILDLIQKLLGSDDIKVGDGAAQAVIGNGYFELYDTPGDPGAPTEDGVRIFNTNAGAQGYARPTGASAIQLWGWAAGDDNKLAYVESGAIQRATGLKTDGYALEVHGVGGVPASGAFRTARDMSEWWAKNKDNDADLLMLGKSDTTDALTLGQTTEIPTINYQCTTTHQLYIGAVKTFEVGSGYWSLKGTDAVAATGALRLSEDVTAKYRNKDGDADLQIFATANNSDNLDFGDYAAPVVGLYCGTNFSLCVSSAEVAKLTTTTFEFQNSVATPTIAVEGAPVDTDAKHLLIQGASSQTYGKVAGNVTVNAGAMGGGGSTHGSVKLQSNGNTIFEVQTEAGADSIAFFGGSVAPKQTVSGARDNPEGALKSLIDAFAAYSAITDTTTAS